MADVKIIDHTEEVINETELAIQKALEICGGKMERYAKLMCPVDTGLLRNSITFVTKTSPGITLSDLGAGVKGGKAFESKSGTVRNAVEEYIETDENNSVIIGTNVSYGIYVETKSYKGKGPNHFLTRAVNDHIDEYKRILEKEIKGALTD